MDFSDQVATMVSPARVATFFLSLLLIAPFICAQVSQPNSQFSAEIAALRGKVFNAQGQPASGIHIEIEDASTSVPVTSTYTQPDGTFELYNIPQGNYEVIADSRDSEVSDQVSLEPGKAGVELRFPANQTAPSPLDATVSVAQMLVPSSAQKMYTKGYKCFKQGKYAEAEKQIDSALQIDPDYADAISLRAMIALSNPDDTTTARQLLERAIHVDSSNSAAYIALAAVYNHEGRFDDAMRASQKGLSLSPRAWQAYLELAKASIAKSMYRSSLQFLRQAERLGGSSYAEVHLVKAYALVPLKLYKEAKYELQASLTREHQSQTAQQAQTMLAQITALETAQLADSR